MSFRSFVRFNFFRFLGLFFLFSLSLQAMRNEDGDLPEAVGQRTPASLIEPLTLTLDTLNRPLGQEGRVALLVKAQQFHVFLPDATVDALMILGSQYVQNITKPSEAEEGQGIFPSLHETLDILDILAQIERTQISQNLPLDPQAPPQHFHSYFSYSRLDRYAPECSFANQQYYLRFFQTIFRETDFNPDLSDLMIEWSLNFMRPSHSETTCTEIATLVRTYITDHLDADAHLNPVAENLLIDADEDQDDWADHEVIDSLTLYLNEEDGQEIDLDENQSPIVQE